MNFLNNQAIARKAQSKFGYSETYQSLNGPLRVNARIRLALRRLHRIRLNHYLSYFPTPTCPSFTLLGRSSPVGPWPNSRLPRIRPLTTDLCAEIATPPNIVNIGRSGAYPVLNHTDTPMNRAIAFPNPIQLQPLVNMEREG